ncbi:MAG: DUF4276 family protein, partial [Terriglobales bacterium]
CGLPCELVLAHSEFETWFVAAAESLRGRRALDDELAAPAEPETIRDAKGWLSAHMPPSTRYSETLDQAALAAAFDTDLARRRSPSFDKFCRSLEALVTALGR